MFYEKYLNARKQKSSFININLDPALPRQRKEMVVSDKYVTREDCKTLLNFSFDIIEQVGDFCCSVKPNIQYFLGASNVLGDLVKKIHRDGLIAILDLKLSDISSTNESALFWLAEMGFDAFTCSPFAGNIKDTVQTAHRKGLGAIVLTLMSNPEAEKTMVKAKVDGQPFYLHIAEAVSSSKADGCVVGLTGFVKNEYIVNIQRIVGEKVVFLLQGLGPQGGKASVIKQVANPLVSLGRSVIYSENPQKTVKKYYDKFKSMTWRNEKT